MTNTNRSLPLLSRRPPRNKNPHFPRHHSLLPCPNLRLLCASCSRSLLQILPVLYLEPCRDIHWMMPLTTSYHPALAITPMTRTRSSLESPYVSRIVELVGPYSRMDSYSAKSSCLRMRERSAEEPPITSKMLTSTKAKTMPHSQ